MGIYFSLTCLPDELVEFYVSGFWGALVLGILLIPFYYIKAGNFSNTAEHRLENVPDAFKQMGNNPVIIAATVGKFPSFVIIQSKLL